MFTCSGILDGKHYNRSIKAHKYMTEALWQLYWKQFVKWTQEEDYTWRLDPLNTSLEELYSEFDDINLWQLDNRMHEKLQVRML